MKRPLVLITWFMIGMAEPELAHRAVRADSTDEQFFEAKIRPVLLQTCFRCHGGEKTSGGLRVDSREALLKGGDSGSAITPNDADNSRLVRALRRDDDVSAMPPDKPLDKAAADAFATWINQGAKWPDSSRAFHAGRHWAFEPLRMEETTEVPSRVVDRFIQRKLDEYQVVARRAADKRTLLRRATLDLIGLPPSEREINAFLADESPEAFQTVMEGLLARPQYGERWGRHWLDVVRYADTAGENSDHPVPHAWRYRNWVIDAFNSDKPYDAFVQEQIAGDLLAADLVRDADAPTVTQRAPRYADLMIATGYLAIARRFGHDIDKDMHLTHEDAIDTLGKSLLGLTIGCARCHSHKYDPISTDDYYALYGILDSTRFAFPGCEPKQQPRDLVSLLPPAEFERIVKPFQDELAALDAAVKKLRDEQTGAIQKSRELLKGTVVARGVFDDGGSGGIALEQSERTHVEPGQLLRLSILPRANYGADTTRIEWEIQEVDGERRTWDLVRDVVDDFPSANPRADQFDHSSVWYFLDPRDGLRILDESLRDLSGKAGLHVWRNGLVNPAVFVNSTAEPIAVWTSLPARTLFAHPAADGGVAIGWLSPISGDVRIRARIADGHPGGGDGVEWLIEHFANDVAATLREIGDKTPAIGRLTRERSELVARQPRSEFAYGVTEGQTKNARIHERGDPEKLGKEVPRRWLELFGGEMVPDGPGSGRRQLAQWLTSPNNPLAARVMVNRIWQQHFGKGLVKTPNDFGTRGQPPTHPELLDWLAAEFLRSGWSMKHMHRVIMLSDTYQRSASTQDDSRGAVANPTISSISQAEHGLPTVDIADLYWQFDRRRLSAEEIRDALLLVSGQLDVTPGGPHPFPPEGSWSFSQHNPFSALVETNRRSVYMMILRNRRHPFLALFDGADPNGSTPQRQMTTVPTQALYFMNDPFVHGCAERLAESVLKDSGADRSDEDHTDRMYRRCLGRGATSDEQKNAVDFVVTYRAELDGPALDQRDLQSWSAFARVLLASNEFLYAE